MKIILRTLYSLFLVFAGVSHFIKLNGFRRIVPNFVPYKTFVVQFTGVLEIIFGIMLWVKKGQSITGKVIAGFMIAVFPANIKMTLQEIPFEPGAEISKLHLWGRLPLQIPLIIGALKLGRR